MKSGPIPRDGKKATLEAIERGSLNIRTDTEK
jgi:hypothetical protein